MVDIKWEKENEVQLIQTRAGIRSKMLEINCWKKIKQKQINKRIFSNHQ